MTDFIFDPFIPPDKPPPDPSSGAQWTPLERQLAHASYVLRMVEASPPYLYTIGLTDLGLPELILFGADTAELQQIWSLFRQHLPDLMEAELFLAVGRLDLVMAPVDPRELGRLAEAAGYYGPREFHALQAFWIIAPETAVLTPQEVDFLTSQPYLGSENLEELLGET